MTCSNRFTCLIALAAALIAGPAFAENPAAAPVQEIKPAQAGEDQPKPEFDPHATGPDKVVGEPALPPAPPVEMKRVAFVGVGTEPLGEGAAKPLGIPEGIGLRVMHVMPDSPAATAGVEVGDVLHKLDDQLLINAEQLRTLVRSHKPGDEVSFTIVRGEKAMQVKVGLVEREVPAQEQAFQVVPGRALNWQPIGPGQRLHIGPDGVIELQPLDLPPDIDALPEIRELHQRMAEQRRIMLEQLHELRRQHGDAPPGAPGAAPAPGPGAGNVQASATAAMSDNEHSIKYSVNNGSKHLTAKDKDGNVLYDGPVNTDAERAKVPDAVRAKFEKLEKQMNVNIRVMPERLDPRPAPPQDDDAVLG